MKILTSRLHGLLDYALVGLFLLAPTLFGFGGHAATMCWLMAGAHGAVSLFTAYPFGVVKLLPFTVHCVEALGAAWLAAAPWILHFDDDPAARNFFLGASALVTLFFVLTKYETPEPFSSQPAPQPH